MCQCRLAFVFGHKILYYNYWLYVSKGLYDSTCPIFTIDFKIASPFVPSRFSSGQAVVAMTVLHQLS